MSLPYNWLLIVLLLGAGTVGSVNAGQRESATPISVCIEADSNCPVVGSAVRFTVKLDPSGSDIFGGQLSLHYDSATLDFISVTPGVSCDPTSPFSTIDFVDINEVAGSIFVVVSTNPGVTAMTPTTIACLTFAAKIVGTAALCLDEGVNPSRTIITDSSGTTFPIDNSTVCPPIQSLPIISCDSTEVLSTCDCLDGTPDCSPLDSDCTIGYCDTNLGACATQAVNEGGVCDDNNSCTLTDRCMQGACVGSGCDNPSLCLVIDDTCELINQGLMVARVALGAGEPVIIGGQVALSFDPASVEVASLAPGSFCDPQSPFSLECFRSVNTQTGRIVYAVPVDPFAGSLGTRGPTTLACITFRAVSLKRSDVCLLTGVNPSFTLLVDQFGNGVDVFNDNDCPGGIQPGDLDCDRTCELIPTVSGWGLIIFALLLLTAGKIHTSCRDRFSSHIGSP